MAVCPSCCCLAASSSLRRSTRGRSVARWIRQQVWPLRWTLYYGMAAAILFFAAFGQSAFIYQQY